MYCSCCGEVVEEDIDGEEVCEDCAAMLNGEVIDAKDPEDLDVETLIE